MAWKTVYAPAAAAAFFAFAVTGGIGGSEKAIRAEERPAPAHAHSLTVAHTALPLVVERAIRHAVARPHGEKGLSLRAAG